MVGEALLDRPAELLPHRQLVPLLDEFDELAVFDAEQGACVLVREVEVAFSVYVSCVVSDIGVSFAWVRNGEISDASRVGGSRPPTAPQR